ncbi:MAG: trigger factor [Candidatus Eiseniibacteriota bacterium]
MADETLTSDQFRIRSVDEPDAWTRAVTIEIDGGFIESEIESTLRTLRKRVDLPGFRKGKVPVAEVRKRFGREVEDEVLERVVEQAVRQAVAERELDLIASPRVPSIDRKAGEPLVFTAECDVRPPIELGEYRGVKVDKVVHPVEDDDVETVLEELRVGRAELEEIERAAEEQDVLTVHVTTLGPGRVPLVGTRRENLRVLLTEAAVPAHWLAGLVGHRAGETVVVEQPELGRQEGERRDPGQRVDPGGEHRYDQLEIVRVEARRVPPMDDDFARTVAQVETLDELRQRVRANLEEEEERRAARTLQRVVLDRLAEAVRNEPPERMVRKAADQLYERATREHPDLTDEAREKLAVEAEREAARRFRHELVVAEVGRREGLQVSRQEAEAAYTGLVKAGLEPADEPASRDRMIEGLRDTLFERKVLKLLVDSADVQVIEQSRRQRRIVTPFDT